MVQLSPLQQFEKIPSETRQFFQEQIIDWFSVNGRNFAWRKTTDPYHILVAEILLQQTDAKKVSLIFEQFIDLYSNILSLAEASLDNLHEFTSKVGLHYRAQRLVNTAKCITADYNGTIPDSENALMTLPGIGKYIANAVLSGAFGQRKAVVDNNIVRLLERFFGIFSQHTRPRTDLNIWAVATRLLPEAIESRTWNYALIDFCGLICTHYNPKHPECVLAKMCHSYQSMLQQKP